MELIIHDLDDEKLENLKWKLEKMGVPNQAMQDKIIAMWALVQGLITIMITNDIKYSESWEEKIEEIIKSVCIAR